MEASRDPHGRFESNFDDGHYVDVVIPRVAAAAAKASGVAAREVPRSQFDRARVVAGFPDCPAAAWLCERLHMGWQDLLDLALADAVERSVSHTLAARKLAEAPLRGVDRNRVGVALIDAYDLYVAQAPEGCERDEQGRPIMRPETYKAIARDRNEDTGRRHTHGRPSWWPSIGQVEAAFGMAYSQIMIELGLPWQTMPVLPADRRRAAYTGAQRVQTVTRFLSWLPAGESLTPGWRRYAREHDDVPHLSSFAGWGGLPAFVTKVRKALASEHPDEALAALAAEIQGEIGRHKRLMVRADTPLEALLMGTSGQMARDLLHILVASPTPMTRNQLAEALRWKHGRTSKILAILHDNKVVMRQPWLHQGRTRQFAYTAAPDVPAALEAVADRPPLVRQLTFAATDELTPRQEQALEVLKRIGPATVKQVAAEIDGVSPVSTNAHLMSLCRLGRATRTQDGKGTGTPWTYRVAE